MEGYYVLEATMALVGWSWIQHGSQSQETYGLVLEDIQITIVQQFGRLFTLPFE